MYSYGLWKVGYHFKFQIYVACSQTAIGFFLRMAGDTAGHQSSDDAVAQTQVEKLAPAFFSIILLIIYLAVMFSYSILLTAVGLTTISVNQFQRWIIHFCLPPIKNI